MLLAYPGKTTSLILRRKLGGPLTGGGGGGGGGVQPVSGRYSLTDHQKKPLTFLAESTSVLDN